MKQREKVLINCGIYIGIVCMFADVVVLRFVGCSRSLYLGVGLGLTIIPTLMLNFVRILE
jgi:hypothetical protein